MSIVALLIAALSFVGVNLAPPTASASVTTVTWPGIPLPAAMLYAHADNSLTVASNDCSYYYNYADATTVIATSDSTGGTPYITPKNTSGWKVPGCDYGRVVGTDGSVYFVQQSSGAQRIVAKRRGATLWIRSFPTGCHGYAASIYNLVLGFDGNIYTEVRWPGDSSGCGNKIDLVSISPGTGNIDFEITLPSGTSPKLARGLVPNEIMPYASGIAVANGDTSVYHYSYSGVLDPSKTFTPPTSGSSPYISDVGTTADGRTYMITKTSLETKLYYRDLNSSTINSMSEPSGKYFAEMYVTPTDGVAILWFTGTVYSFDYYDSSGSSLYNVNLSSDTGAYLPVNMRPALSIDNQGNLIVVRRMLRNVSPYDQEIYVDSFSPTGTKTRAFDSEAEFGTSSKDIFTTSVWTSQSIGNGKIYLTLCHETSGTATTCRSSANPQIVVIPTTSQFDYPRSAVFAALNAQVQYVALGDSYSAGEGNPAFIAPTDNNGGNGCDRSQSNAYPVLLTADVGFSLRAFVACSGATTSDVINGMNGELSQLNSLDASTDVVTLTIGGNNAGFGNFAAQCVTGTCDAASSQYQDTMAVINDPLLLQADVEGLIGQIESHAPSADIYVVGYPDVVGGSTCPMYLSSGEQIAVNTVVTSLNTTLYYAVQNSSSRVHFVDPTSSGSPFIGHDLCSSTSYFFGLNVAEHRFSFHPNGPGQAAYATLIAAAM